MRQHFQALLGDGAAALHQGERSRLLGRLDARPGRLLASEELEAYEALLEHTLLAGDVEEAASLYLFTVRGFGHLGLRLGELTRGLRMVRGFAAPPHGAGGTSARDLAPALPLGMRLRLAYEWGLYAGALGDLADAVRAYEAHGELAQAMEEPTALVTNLRTLAYTHRLRGEGALARTLVDGSIAKARASQLVDDVVRGIALRGALLADEGAFDAALGCFAEARALGDVPVARRSLWEAECALAMGDVARARALTEENVIACDRLGWEGHAAHARVVLGLAALVQGQPAQARAHHDRAALWCRRAGEIEMVLRAMSLDARVLVAEGDGAGAARVLERGRDLAEAGGFRGLASLFDAQR